MTRFLIVMVIGGLLVLPPGAACPVYAREQAPVSVKQESTKEPAMHRAITGLVVDEAGRPIEGAQIIIQQVKPNSSLLFINTDGSGRFKTAKLDPGLYAIDVMWLGYVVNVEGSQPGFHRPGEHLTFNMIKGGVITGRITEESGEPAVGEFLNALRIRDLDGRKTHAGFNHGRTDERGVYRIYGLKSGRYIIRVNADQGAYIGGNVGGVETSTYYPSSTREVAAEITVQTGEEVREIDIQLRSGRGHSIGGMVTGDIGNPDEGVNVGLINANSNESAMVAGWYRAQRFVLSGVPDGEYDLYAQKLHGQGGNVGSALRRVVVRGADVTGLDLKLVRYGTVAGRMIIDQAKVDLPAPRCAGKTPPHLEEIVLDARVDSPTPRRQDLLFAAGEYWGSWRGSSVDSKGEFKIQNLDAGLYRLNIDLPGEDWYIRAITQPLVGVDKKRVDAARAGFAIKPGEQITGVEAVVAEGAASLRGRVVFADEGQSKNRPKLQVHLLPAEEAAAGDLLRYAETQVGKNGEFDFKNLAPGKYWLLAKTAPEIESLETPPRPLAWDEAERAKLRRVAKAAKNEVELKPCERLVDYSLKMNLR